MWAYPPWINNPKTQKHDRQRRTSEEWGGVPGGVGLELVEREAVTLPKMALLRWPGGRTTMVKRLRGSSQSPQGFSTIGPARAVERTARASMATRSVGTWVARASERM